MRKSSIRLLEVVNTGLREDIAWCASQSPAPSSFPAHQLASRFVECVAAPGEGRAPLGFTSQKRTLALPLQKKWSNKPFIYL